MMKHLPKTAFGRNGVGKYLGRLTRSCAFYGLAWIVCGMAIIPAAMAGVRPSGQQPLPIESPPAVEKTHATIRPDAGKPIGNLIDIRIEATRPQPTVGTGLGIQASITNNSDKQVYLNERGTVLVLPPELFGPFGGSSALYSLFPTQHTFATDTQPEPWDGSIIIQPGSTYLAEWSTGTFGNLTSVTGVWSFIPNMALVVASELNYIFFNPGDYKVTVVAQYWTTPDFKPDAYYTASQSATVRVAAPQSVVLFGAALGGLIAYFIFPRRTGFQISLRSRVGAALYYIVGTAKSIAAIAGAMLLSAIVTILLARVSETQFLIRVTVSDFWGAIAVGFIANYVGVKIFERIVPAVGGNDAAGRRRGIAGPGTSEPVAQR